MSNDLQAINRRLKSIRGTQHITAAMKLVSASKYRKAKLAYDNSRGYLRYLIKTIANIIYYEQEMDITSIYEKPSKKVNNVCYILVTGNSGLCGGFNKNLFHILENEMNSDNGHKEIVAVGRKGYDYFNHHGASITAKFFDSQENMNVNDVREIVSPLVKKFEDGEIDELKLISTKFVTSIEQDARCELLLPFDMKRALSSNMIERDESYTHEVEFDPSPAELLKFLIPKYLEIGLHKNILESAACEQASRRNAMENATNNANDMINSLSKKYNRARQAAITNELIEVVSGSEASI